MFPDSVCLYVRVCVRERERKVPVCFLYLMFLYVCVREIYSKYFIQ